MERGAEAGSLGRRELVGPKRRGNGGWDDGWGSGRQSGRLAETLAVR